MATNKICILMFFDEPYKNIAKYTYELNKKYADLHGYDIIIRNDRKLNNEWAPLWEKIPLIIDNLEKYEWVLFIDADAFFINHTIKIEDIIMKELKDNNEIWFIGSDEYDGGKRHKFNSGVMIIKNCKKSMKLMIETLEYASKYCTKIKLQRHHEQDALLHLIQTNNLCNNGVKIINDNYINCPDPSRAQYIFHAYGSSHHSKESVLNNYYNQFLQNGKIEKISKNNLKYYIESNAIKYKIKTPNGYVNLDRKRISITTIDKATEVYILSDKLYREYDVIYIFNIVNGFFSLMYDNSTDFSINCNDVGRFKLINGDLFNIKFNKVLIKNIIFQQ